MLDVLVIDDAPETHVLLEAILSDEPIRLRRADDGASGLAAARAQTPDLILLDVVMPGLDGFEVLTALSAVEELEHVPVLFLSARSDGPSKVRGFELGAVDYIAKPFDPAEVVARLRRHLAVHGRERRLQAFVDDVMRRRRSRDEAPHAVLLGPSPAARRLRRQVQTAARDDKPVFLVGPRQEGSDGVAEAIHRQSPRGEVSLVRCEGSDIRDTPSSLALARRRAGSGSLYVADAHLLSAAAWREVLTLVHRAPTRWLLQVPTTELMPSWWASVGAHSVTLPALSERMTDVPALVDALLAAQTGGSPPPVHPATREMLGRYRWPGGIEELREVLEATMAHTQQAEFVVPADLLQGGPYAGHYQVLERIGGGGMGSVFRARHRVLGQDAVVKVISGALPDDAARARFRREARVTSGLSSQHTVRLFDFGRMSDGSFYYVMERLQGWSLRQLVKRSGPLPAARVIHLLEQAAASLEEAHAAGLVHADIKPGNLFVSRAGLDLDVLKVLDFGVVREAGDDGQELAGTPHYMAPELMEGGVVDARADLYALACAAYYALTGRTVFQAKSLPGLFLAHFRDEPTPPGHHAPDVPAELDELVVGMLAKEPSGRRPASATELRRRLQRLESDHPWTAEQAEAAWGHMRPTAELPDEHLLPTLTIG
jgi:DNA-binding response OmpR family regulator/aminoglycoside phosphotransferase (APT) family kinase protein